MDPIEQNQSAYQQPVQTTPPSGAVVLEKKHFSTLSALLILIVLAGALFLFIRWTDITQQGNNMMRQNSGDSYMMGGEPVQGIGEVDGAVAQESAAIRTDLEANNADGVSEGI